MQETLPVVESCRSVRGEHLLFATRPKQAHPGQMDPWLVVTPLDGQLNLSLNAFTNVPNLGGAAGPVNLALVEQRDRRVVLVMTFGSIGHHLAVVPNSVTRTKVERWLQTVNPLVRHRTILAVL